MQPCIRIAEVSFILNSSIFKVDSQLKEALIFKYNFCIYSYVCNTISETSYNHVRFSQFNNLFQSGKKVINKTKNFL
jgi:hypothetical protein